MLHCPLELNGWGSIVLLRHTGSYDWVIQVFCNSSVFSGSIKLKPLRTLLFPIGSFKLNRLLWHCTYYMCSICIMLLRRSWTYLWFIAFGYADRPLQSWKPCKMWGKIANFSPTDETERKKKLKVSTLLKELSLKKKIAFKCICALCEGKSAQGHSHEPESFTIQLLVPERSSRLKKVDLITVLHYFL